MKSSSDNGIGITGGPATSRPPATAGIRLVAVVNGMPAEVHPPPDMPLIRVVQRALEQTHNAGRPLDDWTVTNAMGRLLDPSRSIREYAFEDGETLFVQVAVGAGGSA